MQGIFCTEIVPDAKFISIRRAHQVRTGCEKQGKSQTHRLLCRGYRWLKLIRRKFVTPGPGSEDGKFREQKSQQQEVDN